MKCIITPHVCEVSGVIVLTSSVCVSVCVLPLSRPNGQTYGLEFRHVGQEEKYLGQVCRSRSRGQKTFQWVFQWNVSRRSSMISWMELPKNRLANITVMNTVMWGVFKAYAFSFIVRLKKLHRLFVVT